MWHGAGSVPPDPYLNRLIAAINDSARTARIAMTTLLVVIVYLGAVSLAADHEALLRETAAKLPQVGVSLPLVSSFALAPPILLFLHLTLLIQIDLLGAKLRGFEEATRRLPEARKRRYRLLVFPFVFAQIHLDGAPGWRNAPMAVVSWLALVGLPLTLLVIVLVRFLPYQSETISFVHRIAVAFDLLLLLFFYVRRQRHGFLKSWRAIGKHVPLQVAPAAAVLWFAFLQATIPEPKDNGNAWNVLDKICGTRLFPELGCRHLVLNNRTLVAREAPDVILAQFARDNDAGLRNAEVRHSRGLFLRGRSLRRAQLRGSRFFGTDLVGANLKGVNLRFSSVRNANLSRAKLQGANLFGADLQGANLQGADLQGTDLGSANLQGAYLGGIVLWGANLRNANLRGVVLRGAYLQGANLQYARLQGADLRGAFFRIYPLASCMEGRVLLRSESRLLLVSGVS